VDRIVSSQVSQPRLRKCAVWDDDQIVRVAQGAWNASSSRSPGHGCHPQVRSDRRVCKAGRD
jgi:hypothetical protein